MRNIKLKDCFECARLVTNLGIKDELKKIAIESEGKNVSGVGFDIMFTILSQATTKEAEIKINGFISHIFEIEESEVKNLDITDLIDQFTENDNARKLVNFIKKVVQ